MAYNQSFANRDKLSDDSLRRGIKLLMRNLQIQ